MHADRAVAPRIDDDHDRIAAQDGPTRGVDVTAPNRDDDVALQRQVRVRLLPEDQAAFLRLRRSHD